MKVILAVVKQLKQLQEKPRKTFWGFNEIQTNYLSETSAMLYQLSYVGLLGIDKQWAQFIPVMREGGWCGNIGNVYHSLGQYENAQFHKKHLSVCQETADLPGEGK